MFSPTGTAALAGVGGVALDGALSQKSHAVSVRVAQYRVDEVDTDSCSTVGSASSESSDDTPWTD